MLLGLLYGWSCCLLLLVYQQEARPFIVPGLFRSQPDYMSSFVLILYVYFPSILPPAPFSLSSFLFGSSSPHSLTFPGPCSSCMCARACVYVCTFMEEWKPLLLFGSYTFLPFAMQSNGWWYLCSCHVVLSSTAVTSSLDVFWWS